MSLQSAETLVQQGNQAYLDEDYKKAKEFFTIALQLDSSSEIYANRAAALLKLEMFEEVVQDCDEAIKLNPKNQFAHLRKGIAQFSQDDFSGAKTTFEEGKKLFPNQNQFKTWAQKCEAELGSSKAPKKEEPKKEEPKKEEPKKEAPKKEEPKKEEPKKEEPKKEEPKKEAPKKEEEAPKVEEMQLEETPKTQKPTIKHEWFQSDTYVIVTIFIKNLKKEDVQVNLTERTLSVTIKLPTGSDYSLEIDLAQDIVVGESKTNVMSTKVEIKLKKAAIGLKWAALEGEEMKKELKPHYPSSSKKAHNWDKLESEVKKEEAEEKPEGDAALNALFKQIYSNGSEEQRRAMMKSFQESGGTKLSTNWEDVGKEKQKVQPPSGMEYKKYEY